jgi:DivIVA domain-containing protein
VLSFLLFVVGVLVVGGLLFLAGSVLLGRGETQPPAELDRSPMELPDDRPVVGDDIRALRIAPAVRGYRMSEVDWLLDQFAQTLDERDEEIVRLRSRLAATRPSPHPHGETGAHAAEPAEPPVEEQSAEDDVPGDEVSEGAVPTDQPAGDDGDGARTDA